MRRLAAGVESGEGVTLQRQDEQRYPLADITVSAALGNIPLTLTFKDGARFARMTMRPSAAGSISAVRRAGCIAWSATNAASPWRC
ncbi:hypothetical protein M8494_37910 [Serratia ureilytica]